MEIFEIKNLKNIQDKLNILLINAINENASIGFLNALNTEDSNNYWNCLQNDLDKLRKKLFIVKEKKNIVASVVLSFSQKENAQHRAEVEKLMVHSAYQGLGIATNLMNHLENIAKENDKSLLILDTRHKDRSSFFYEKIGYEKAGQIPFYSLNKDCTYSDTIIYYKKI